VGIFVGHFLGISIGRSQLALAELLKPYRYGIPADPGEFWLYGILSLVFLIFAIVYLVALRPSKLAGE
jgi:hypothetical protein